MEKKEIPAYQAELVLDGGASLAEGPLWDAKRGLLYWVDIPEGRLNFYDPATGDNRSVDVGRAVGVAVPRESGGVVLALDDGFYAFDPDADSAKPRSLAVPGDLPAGFRFNDGKCDPKGRFWAGTLDPEDDGRAALYCLEPDLTLNRVIEGVTISNGIAWSPDQRTMYYVDTPTQQVVAYDYDLASGALGNPETVVVIPEKEGMPDGMTADEEGMLWVAHWKGHQVSRWNPQSGERIGTVEVPPARVTSCAFGGPERDHLYITTASHGSEAAEREEQPGAGGLFRLRTDVRGPAAVPFAG